MRRKLCAIRSHGLLRATMRRHLDSDGAGRHRNERIKIMRKFIFAASALAAGLALAAPAYAQRPEPGTGPVAAACQQDIEKLCANTTHERGAARDCLEKNKAKVSAACAKALDTTGGGRRR